MLCKWQSKLETNLYKEDYLDFRIIGGFEDYGPMKLMKKEVKNIQKIKLCRFDTIYFLYPVTLTS